MSKAIMRQTRFALNSFVLINLQLYVVFSYTEYSSYYSVKTLQNMCKYSFSFNTSNCFLHFRGKIWWHVKDDCSLFNKIIVSDIFKTDFLKIYFVFKIYLHPTLTILFLLSQTLRKVKLKISCLMQGRAVALG